MNANIRIALAIAVFILLWLISGVFKDSESKTTEQTLSNGLTKVQVSQFLQRSFVPELSLRSHTEPYRVVELRAEVTGSVSAVPGRRGAMVQEGQPICVIESRDRRSRVDRALAHLEQAQIAYRGALQLKTAGYQSELAIAQAKADMETAKLVLKQSEIDFENLTIRAPFTAIVETRPLEIGDFVSAGQLCAKLVELNPIKVIAQASEAEIAKLKLGDSAVAEFFTHKNVGAKISYVAHEANNRTRSYRIEATAENPNLSLRAGMSGRLNISQTPVEAHLISASLIVLDAQGEPSVRAVDENNLVKQINVSLVGETEQGIWVQGLPETITLITVGQNYVSDGELVDSYFPVSGQ